MVPYTKTLHKKNPKLDAKEVGELLGISNHRVFVSTLDEDEKGDVIVTDTSSHRQKMTLISESGLYRFIMRSNKPDAIIFQKWVCKEVLPSIRRTGKFELEKEMKELRVEYEKTMSNLQYLTNESKNINKRNYTITERLIFLNIVDADRVKKLLQKYDDGIWDRYLKDRSTYMNITAQISKKLSSKKRQIDENYPKITRTKRRNIYEEGDFVRFGDDIIKNFVVKKPINQWNIDWEYLDTIQL